ncbi:MAG: prepilin-type N-terminal cleavage/methylation domain-containing protein [Gemmatimonadaceae bacterium]
MKISLRSFSAGRIVPRLASEKVRQGFVLVEVIVAMVILAIAVSSLAALMYSVSQSGMKQTGNAYRNGVLMQEVNRLEALPYDSLPISTTSYSQSSGNYAHTRVVTIAQPVANVKTVKVVITPVNARYKKDSVMFSRTRARTSKYLCVTCQ